MHLLIVLLFSFPPFTPSTINLHSSTVDSDCRFPLQLSAFEKLLQDYPQWRGNVVLIQVTSPALNESPKLERQVSELVAHINGEYGSLDFIPVHH